MLITEIQYLMLPITLAKANIVNPTIFDHDNLKLPTEVPIVKLIETSIIKVL